MSKIKIKNFGPIKEGHQEKDGWIDIKKVTLFIGNQGSGKSTVAKLISTFIWIEKVLVRGDYDYKWFTKNGRFQNQYLAYHRIENYCNWNVPLFDETLIEYKGEAFHIRFEKGRLEIFDVKKEDYQLPQIMYVPAERNFLTYVKNPNELRLTSEALKEFLTEYDKAKSSIKNSIRLPINDVEIEYNSKRDFIAIKTKNYKIKLTEASSGFQSYVPLYLVSWYLANSVKNENSSEPMSGEELERFRRGVADIWSNTNLTDEQKRVAISVLSSKFNKTAFINIVEEPEQNLFPSSQWEMLKSLLEFNNSNHENRLIMTTHSPYILNYLSIAIQAGDLIKKLYSDELKDKLNKLIPIKSLVDSVDVAIYQFDETGKISKLPDYEGIPSDRNYLNNSIAEGNKLFDSLLELEQAL